MPNPSYGSLPLSEWTPPSILVSVRRARNQEAKRLIKSHDSALKKWERVKRAEKQAFDNWQFSVARVRQYYRETEASR
jgi:hypothetical protein